MSTTVSANNLPSVSVIVPHFDDCFRLRLCLQSLQAQHYPGDRLEIIVADNGTPGGIGDLRDEFDAVKFISVSERGAAAARNAAMSIAAGDVFAFTDADCVAEPDWLITGIRSLKSADYVGGRINVTSNKQGQPTSVEAFELVFGFRQEMYIERKHFSATANLFVSRSAAEAIGPFKNKVAEDLDWGRRAQALGLRLAFSDKSVVNHPARTDWPSLKEKWERLVRERWNGLGALNFFVRMKWAVLAVATALSAAPHIWVVAKSDRLIGLRDRLNAVRVLTQIRLWRARRMLALLFVQH